MISAQHRPRGLWGQLWVLRKRLLRSILSTSSPRDPAAPQPRVPGMAGLCPQGRERRAGRAGQGSEEQGRESRESRAGKSRAGRAGQGEQGRAGQGRAGQSPCPSRCRQRATRARELAGLSRPRRRSPARDPLPWLLTPLRSLFFSISSLFLRCVGRARV